MGLVITFFADFGVRALFEESPDFEVAKEALKLVSGVCFATYGISCAVVYLIDNSLLKKGVNID